MFAKLYNTPDGRQVLITHCDNNDENRPEVRITFEPPKALASMVDVSESAAMFADTIAGRRKAQQAFDEMTEARAFSWLDTIDADLVMLRDPE